MKRTTLALTLLVVLAAALTLTGVAAFAQSEALAGLLAPLVLTVEQSVPVELAVATTLDDGATVTSTVPITVGINLQITIEGDQVVAVAGEADPAAVAAAALPAGEQLLDNSAIPYTLEAAAGFQIAQVRSQADYNDDFSLIGEIANATDEEAQFLQINVTLFDADGAILDTANGYPELDPLGPGRTSAFEVSTNVPLDDVASYRIQVEP